MSRKTLVHLQPLGGIAGDMFIAALLDAFPRHHQGLVDAIRASGLSAEQVSLKLEAANDCGLQGARFHVAATQQGAHHHAHYSTIRRQLKDSGLPAGVREHALGIFQLLAEAEAKIHDRPVDEVAFHEVGAWDSIADIVGAAYLIDALEGAHWYSDPLPLGRGSIESAHGTLPVPAPATALLMEGMPTFSDRHAGERVTPTGAAILRYLAPEFVSPPAGTLRASGMGFGSRRFEGMANLLRVLVFDTATELQQGQVGVIEFEVDDQSPEELAIGLEHLRQEPAVFDVLQQAVYAKKARLATQVRVLCDPHHLTEVAGACFRQTTTLGVRWQQVNRLTLEREMHEYRDGEGRSVRVKHARRPGGKTAKAEIDDVRDGASASERRRLRQAAEAVTLEKGGEDDAG